MPFDNSSASWKIDRASELLDVLDGEVLAWIDTKPYSFATYINPEFTRASLIVREHHPPPIIRWSLMMADIVHNLRCALDHTFWALLQNEFPSGIPERAERLSFPIWDGPPTKDQWRKFEPIGTELFGYIESVQLYNHPDQRFPVHPLAIIRDIDNGNKHKLLFTLMPSIAALNIRVSNLLKINNGADSEQVYRGELREGVEVIATTFSSPEPSVKYECRQFSCIIAVKHPIANRLGRDRDDYAYLIDALIEQVRGTMTNLVAAM